MDLKIMSLNIHHGAGIDTKIDLYRIASLILKQNPDFVALQEVDFNVNRSRNVNQAQILGELTGMFSFFAKHMDYQNGLYGQAILSKIPIISIDVHPFNEISGSEQRSFVETSLLFNNTITKIISVHFDPNMNSEINNKQALKLVELYHNDSVILTGDFNADISSKTINIIKQYWKSDQIFYTFPKNKKKIDWIFLPKNWDFNFSYTLVSNVSDHYGIVSDISHHV